MGTKSRKMNLDMFTFWVFANIPRCISRYNRIRTIKGSGSIYKLIIINSSVRILVPSRIFPVIPILMSSSSKIWALIIGKRILCILTIVLICRPLSLPIGIVIIFCVKILSISSITVPIVFINGDIIWVCPKIRTLIVLKRLVFKIVPICRRSSILGLDLLCG